MTTLPVQWQYAWLGALGQHLSEVLTPLLPSDREILVSGLTLSIIVRRDGERLRTAVTVTMPTPDETSAVSAHTADRIFANLQDEIAIHLAAAWPMSTDGQPLHALATESEDVIELSFEPRGGDGSDRIVLDPFVPPPPPDEARVAG